MAATDVMRPYVDAARRGDFETAFGMLSEDVVFHIPGRSPLAGEHRGRAAAMETLNAARNASSHREVELKVIDTLTSENRFALVVTERFHTDGGPVDINRTNVYTVRGDEIVEIWIFEADQYAADAIFA